MPASYAPQPRTFLPATFQVTTWPEVQPYYEVLTAAVLDTETAFHTWLAQVEELHNVLQETLARRYIAMTCNTQDTQALEQYQYFLEHISPEAARADQTLREKFLACPHADALAGPAYELLKRDIAKDAELFRPENVDLQSQIDLKAQEYASIIGAMTVELGGQTLTLPQASARMEQPDRAVREAAWRTIEDRRAQDRTRLNQLFTDLLTMRHRLAQQAGYANYTDYKYRELGRHDYGRAETEAFRHAIGTVVTPLYTELHRRRQEMLGVEELRPWDLAVDLFGHEPLKPFNSGKELIDQSLGLFQELRPELADMLGALQAMGHLDVESRPGKAPGGYNYPLHETGVPFIFMNAVGTQGDLTTLVHEAGHAFHAVLTRQLTHSLWKNPPSEVAELASMGMELITMASGWQRFYTDPADLRRARLQQLLRCITILPWVAVVDAFQTWAYDHPQHTEEERRLEWVLLHERYLGQAVSWQGLEESRAHQWHKQLHIYEVPFYYIEYGMAQLGALQLWRNYTQNPQGTLERYLQALALGYTRPIGQIYETAGVSFDFSESMLADLMAFTRQQLAELGYWG